MDEIHAFEDGVELCLEAVNDAKSLEEARKTIQDYLALVKENKLDRMKKNIWVLEKRTP